jgi:hypothetical protein
MIPASRVFPVVLTGLAPSHRSAPCIASSGGKLEQRRSNSPAAATGF